MQSFKARGRYFIFSIRAHNHPAGIKGTFGDADPAANAPIRLDLDDSILQAERVHGADINAVPATRTRVLLGFSDEISGHDHISRDLPFSDPGHAPA